MLDRTEAINAAARDLREYVNTEPVRALLKLLGLLADEYRDTLLTVTPEHLLRTQGAAAQVLALHQAISAAEPMPPRV